MNTSADTSTLPRLLQVNVSRGGIPKTPLALARVTLTRVEGDDWHDHAHHGLPGQAVCLFSIELIRSLQAEGFPLFPGALGENFTTEGLDYRSIRLGDAYGIGPEVEIRITKIRTPCRTITCYGEGIREAIYDAEVRKGDVQSPRWGRSGYYAEVLREGIVRSGDRIVLRARR